MCIDKLSDRERAIIEMISLGFTDREIGESIFISSFTVKSHRQNSIKKLGARNSCHMISIAHKMGLL